MGKVDKTKHATAQVVRARFPGHHMGRQKENDVGMPQTSQSPQLVEERQTEASFFSVGILGSFFQKNLGDGDTIEIKIHDIDLSMRTQFGCN